MTQKLNYVSLFTGAGGLDIGLEQAGFKALSLCEIEDVFCKTLEANRGCTHADGIDYFKETRILNADIRDLGGATSSLMLTSIWLLGGHPVNHSLVLESS